jgi:hypothetical protein
VVEYELPYTLDPLRTLTYRERKAAATFDGGVGLVGQINSLSEAQLLLGLPSGHVDILAEATAKVRGISFQDPQAGGGQAGVIRVPFLTDTTASDDDFAAQAFGYISIPSPGDWTFAITHDDQIRLTIGPYTLTDLGTGNPDLVTWNFSTTGWYPLDLLFFERGGGAYLQLFAAQGSYSVFDPNVFRLVGDTYNGGLEVVSPEPTTLALALIGAAAAARRLRRSRKSA